jgi:histidinol-phosphatase (PHP family)
MLVDYHVHTSFSSDSPTPMEEQCRAAIVNGIQHIAFTEHEDYNPIDPCSFFYDYPSYVKEIERCRKIFHGQLVIRSGIEIGEPHRFPTLAAKALGQHEWDFVLGSLHFLSSTVNSLAPEFASHLGDWRKSFAAYFTEMIALAHEGDFDVLAHIDYPARYNRDAFPNYDIREFEPVISDVLREIIRRGKGIEINTAPMRWGNNPNPPECVIRWYRELGGEILTVGSDAHVTKHVGFKIDESLNIARRAGFTHIATFKGRKPTFERII